MGPDTLFSPTHHVAEPLPLGQVMSAIARVAEDIDRLLSEVISLQIDVVSGICSVCPEPCCKRVQHLFDEKDMIFARVSRGVRKPQRRLKRGKGCPFLSENGCRLPPGDRPYICHRYICSRLEEGMVRVDPGRLRILGQKFRRLEELRGQLWCAYLEAELEAEA